MTALVDVFIHLPGVRVERPQAFAGGHVKALGFDEWQMLDGSFDFSARAYEQNAAQFWVGQLTITPGMGEAACQEAAFRQASLLHRALLLDRRAPPLASPLLSCIYVSLVARPSFTVRIIGQAEREWIVFGGVPEVAFDNDALAHATGAGSLLTGLAPNTLQTTLGNAFDVLERTARPEYWHDLADKGVQLSSFVQCVASCEGLVSAEREPDGSVGLTDRFGQRMAAALAPTFEDQRAFAREMADIYRLRSRLMHGRIATTDLKGPDEERIARGRELLRAVAAVALILARRGVQPDTLPTLLADAGSNPEVFAFLKAKLEAKTGG